MAILDAFSRLMADPANLFLAHNERATYLWYKHFLQSFSTLYGRVSATELKPIHVTRWLDANTVKGGHIHTQAGVH